MRHGGIVSQIVDRCHVGQSYLRVCRYVVSRLRPGAFAAMPRSQRLALLRQAIDEHRENREQYTFVMRGCRRGLKPMGLLTVKG